MSIKAKIVYLSKYGGFWLLFFMIQIMAGFWLWRHAHGRFRRPVLTAWAVFLAAYCVVPLDYAFGWTLPVAAYRMLVLSSIVWQAAFLPALLGFVLASRISGRPRESRWPAALAGVLFLAGAFSGARGVQNALAPPRLLRLRVPVPGLHGRITILHVTDIHAGYFQSASDIARLRDLVPGEPDLVVFTGDQMHGNHAPFLRFLEEGIARLPARLGKFQVAGNHDHRLGEAPLYEALSRAGVTPLDDRHVVLDTPAGPLVVAGVDDVHYGGNLRRALAGLPPGIPVLLLSHRPEVLPEAAAAGVRVILAGHTHGGQVCLGSWICLSDFEGSYRRGVYRHGDAWMNVSSGLGTTGLPVRLFSPPDAAWIELEGER